MAALLPTILSDDDESYTDGSGNRNCHTKKGGGGGGSSKKAGRNKSRGAKQVPNTGKGNINEADDDEDNNYDHDDGITSSDDEMDQDFEFGGLLVRRLRV